VLVGPSPGSRYRASAGALAAAAFVFCGGACKGVISGGPVESGGAGTGVAGTAGTGTSTSNGGAGGTTMSGVAGAVAVTAASLCASGAAPPVMPGVRIRRLTRLEVQNTVTDLLGADAAALANGLEPDSQALGFSTGDQRGVSAAYAAALSTMATGLATTFRKTVATPTFAASCFATDAGARTCADTFVRDFARRAFRRPLDDREVTALLGVYDAGRETGVDADATDRFRAGLDYTLRAVLQSPHFIFRTELGDGLAPAAAATQLTPYELASALSYGTIASPPDETLLAAAAAHQLVTTAQITAQVRRLLASRPERFKTMVQRFAIEWLSIDYDKPAWKKDATAYPKFTTTTRDAFAGETRAFLDDWIDGGSAFPALLTSTNGFIDRDNAAVYGLTSTSPTFVKTPLPAGQRAGLLTQPSFLGSAAHTDGSSPVYRGLAVLSRFLCKTPPPVPAMVPPLPPVDKTVIKTTRQRYATHTTAAFCAACHSAFDPMGYVFENYDGIGQWRTQENGVAVDPSGAVVGTQLTNGPMANAVALSQALATSPEVHECFARQVFRFDVGRVEGDGDTCTIADVTKTFGEKNLDLRELLVAIAMAPSFATRVAAAPGGP
jgi:Protein of unknown function (DUF1592)/Protein of unknown function (DUF1588)/Protein of unknown function (DUF1595)/Protein of unknown function (DUF1585)/Protein of unknown function (DUF1587)